MFAFPEGEMLTQSLITLVVTESAVVALCTISVAQVESADDWIRIGHPGAVYVSIVVPTTTL